jgi:phosphatidylserine/phosphatidylglycerophosphate/cardiolipin synthase-like enzyme
MLFDLVDGFGDRNAGIFLQAYRLHDTGAKLLNVALSRAREGIVVFANLTFLDQKLPTDAFLRGVLVEMQRTGQVLDVREILQLRPVADELGSLQSKVELDPEALRTGLFPGPDFDQLWREDLRAAKQSIVIFSGFITPDRVMQLVDVLQERIASGVRVRCVTRPPDRNGTIPESSGRSALLALESIGAVVDLRSEIHEKVVIVDGRVVWFGSLNPLSHTQRTSELMARVDDSEVATHLTGILSLRRRTSDQLAEGRFADAENPRCEKCGSLTVLIRGQYGPFFRCCEKCGWTCSLQNQHRARRR